MKAEDRFVERLRALRTLPSAADPVVLGIGDDAAVIRGSAADTAVTTDLLVEGVDFLPGEDPERLGRRAVSVNLSDLAAMGARPRWFLLSLAIPDGVSEDFAFDVCRGAARRGAEFGAVLAGGDLSRGPAVFVSIAMAGDLDSPPLSRSGARPGDHLYLTGSTGRAAAGLALARGDDAPEELDPAQRTELLAAYRDPEPRISVGLALSRGGLARAAIDISDGLGIDAARLSRASGVRAVVLQDQLPIAPALAAFCAGRPVFALDRALSGGDDYELLFAARPGAARALECLPVDVPITAIGYFEEGSGAVLRDASGGDRDIAALGYDHLEAAP